MDERENTTHITWVLSMLVVLTICVRTVRSGGGDLMVEADQAGWLYRMQYGPLDWRRKINGEDVVKVQVVFGKCVIGV